MYAHDPVQHERFFFQKAEHIIENCGSNANGTPSNQAEGDLEHLWLWHKGAFKAWSLIRLINWCF